MAGHNAPVSRREAGAYTYMLECSDGTLYTGYTVDLDHRLATMWTYQFSVVWILARSSLIVPHHHDSVGFFE